MENIHNLTIKDFQSVCRFCLQRDISLKPIFKHENDGGFDDFYSDTSDEGIVKMISICTGLETIYTDGLPLFICDGCYNKLLASNTFRKQCIASIEILKKIKSQHTNSLIKTEHELEHTNTQNGSNTEIDSVYIEEPYSSPCHFSDDNSNDDVKQEDEISIDATKELDKSNNILSCQVICEPLPVLDKKETAPSKRKRVTKKDIDPKKPKPMRKRDRERLERRLAKQAKEKKPRVRKQSKPEQCDICGFISRSLKSHMLVHTQEKNFECDFCGKKFSLRASLKNHIFAHINIRPFKCMLCHQTFITSCKRKNHMITHTGERRHSCDVCGKRFAQAGPRDVHRLTHTQLRQHKCEYCGKLFLLKHQLKNHVGIHTGERSYSCGMCPLTFINSSGVSSHRRVHKEGNEYRCQICQMKIKELRFLKIHIKDHTPSFHDVGSKNFQEITIPMLSQPVYSLSIKDELDSEIVLQN